MAAASVYLMNLDSSTYWSHVYPQQSHINVGYGSDVSIADLAKTIAKVINYQGNIIFDVTKPDGAPRKFMDSKLLNKLGWSPKVDLATGLKKAYTDFLDHK
jgi:GDP-L-fucose synthase